MTAVYLLAIRLPPSPERTRLLEDCVREWRWSRHIESHRAETMGIDAGRGK